MLITDLADARPAIVGLGYVGLPLAVEFGRKYPTVGFDINHERVAELRRRRDSTLEVTAEDLAASTQLSFSTELQDIAPCNVYIVTVPTPIDATNVPTWRRCVPPARQSVKSSSAATSSSMSPPSIRAHRRSLCADHREDIRAALQQGFLRRLQPGAHQSGRQAAPADDDHEGHVGVDAARRRTWSIAVWRSSRQERIAPRASRWRKPRK